MIVTEEEAKTKQCQEGIMPTMVMPSGSVSYAYTVPRCRGSACMAWRWHEAIYVDGVSQVRDPPRGFCGKAGRP